MTDARTRLAAGDGLAVVALVLAGELRHGVTDPLQVVTTIAPFVVGWFVAAAILDVYAAVPDTVTRSVRLGVGTWIAAANIGLILRVHAAGETAATPFPLVMTTLGVLVVGVWRTVATRVV